MAERYVRDKQALLSRLQRDEITYREQAYAQIPSFDYYNVALRLAPDQNYNLRAMHFEEAKDKARMLNTLSPYGRRAAIYGIKKDGQAWIMPYDA